MVSMHLRSEIRHTLTVLSVEAEYRMSSDALIASDVIAPICFICYIDRNINQSKFESVFFSKLQL